MANWKNKVDISSLLTDYEDDDLAPREFAHKVADKLDALNIQDEDFQEIIQNFRYINEFDSEEDAINVLSDLYDWGDVDHRLWVKTF